MLRSVSHRPTRSLFHTVSEGLFSELREYAQSPSVCSAVFPIQWEGGLRSEGRRVLSSPFASSNCSWVRSSAPERTVPERFAPERAAKERSGCKEGSRLRHAFHFLTLRWRSSTCEWFAIKPPTPLLSAGGYILVPRSYVGQSVANHDKWR